ncbi:MAG: tRNA pseudouridine(38-40) synthase TruA [Candidatus Nanopelagicaceae bacterium]
MKEPTLAPESGFFRIRIDLSYDGTNFYGWGKQADRRTVQGELEAAIFTLFQQNLDTVVAGRTDAGVHASGQVCHVDVPENDYTDIAYRLNRILNDEIRIKSVARVSNDFHARFGALRRHYIYKIKDGNSFIEPTARLDITPWYRKLDVELMNQAAATLIGEHDFFSYARFREKATTSRDLQRFEFERTAEGLIISHITADAFLYNMVRALIGTMVYIGEGRFPVTWAKEVLEKKERPSDSVVFPAKGLTFVGVDYPAESELRSRILKTMQHRDAEEE